MLVMYRTEHEAATDFVVRATYLRNANSSHPIRIILRFFLLYKALLQMSAWTKLHGQEYTVLANVDVDQANPRQIYIHFIHRVVDSTLIPRLYLRME
jgi:hypothetical protein